MPFVQGQLLKEKFSFVLQTECGHCRQPIEIEIDSDLNINPLQAGAEPLVYALMIDIHALEPSIIDGF